MKRVFGPYAYSDAPRTSCWWDDTVARCERPSFEGPQTYDVAIIGAGFTGVSAAYHLAKADVAVAVLDAQSLGWGASGRNGGFCCLGGGKLDDQALDKRFGASGRIAFRRTEKAAVDLVDNLTSDLKLDVDRHSHGETELAHRPKDFRTLSAQIGRLRENYEVDVELIEAADLAKHGMNGAFHGGLTIRAGFGLNPRKYIDGLAWAAEQEGAKIFDKSPVNRIEQTAQGFALHTPKGELNAERVIVATNGYSSDDLPDWLAGRYLPSQSNVLVTRPLTSAELNAQGWQSEQMAFDTRNLLHYFRLMPDRRFLFGLRGGLLSSPAAEKRARVRARHDFEKMFPAWRHVETTHNWSGMVCIARHQLPFVGEVPEVSGAFIGLCYHGNGVAMGSYAGALLADLVQGNEPERLFPEAMKQPLKRFELGRFRRLIMPGAYAAFALADL